MAKKQGFHGGFHDPMPKKTTKERMYDLPQWALRKVATGEWTLEEAENGGPDFKYISADCADGCDCDVCTSHGF